MHWTGFNDLSIENCGLALGGGILGTIVTLINPNIVFQRNDIFTTGIVYMPIGLAYFAAAVSDYGFECNVIDAFGEKPNQYYLECGFGFRGLTPSEVAERIEPNSKAVVLYASNITYHSSIIRIIRAVRLKFPTISIIVLENTQAVTAYSLSAVQETFHEIGADYIVTGEGENRGIKLLQKLLMENTRGNISSIDGVGFRENRKIHYSPCKGYIEDLDNLSFPAWDLFPLKNYWRLKYAHGPFETKRYLPILTSRGCPYHCNFCVIPQTNDGNWRGRSAGNVVDEIEAHSLKYGVNEFHIEDVNPTVNDGRTREICEELLRRKLVVEWKLCSGTKVETIKDEKTIETMARAGCRYISISPETGSSRLLKMMNKPFNLVHAVRLIKKMSDVGIYSQACFVLGYPGENDEDLQMTRDLVRNLAKVGVDEIALFIVVPVPGAAIFKQFSGYRDYSQLNFSPTWRVEYRVLNQFRFKLYRDFLFWKTRYHPKKILQQPFNFAMRRFKTKMEMTPYRALHTMLLGTGIVGKKVQNEN